MSDKLTKRIREIIEFKELSSSMLADKIGINRSRVSHILTGRNNPSLEIVEGILKAFPDINPDWLISGSGPKFRTGQDALHHVSKKEDEQVLNTDLFSYKQSEERKKQHSQSVQFEEKKAEVIENVTEKLSDEIESTQDQKTNVTEKSIQSRRPEIKMITVLYDNNEYEILYPQLNKTV
ncbi:helix-turn-helix domain-containing protein [Bacteroidota bacterium]